MKQDTYNLISTIISIASFVLTIAGLFIVYVQIVKIKESTWSNTHSNLCNESFELLKFFSEHPETYDYFYKRKVLEDKAKDKVIILYATEALANFLEHLTLQKGNLPARQWEVWKRFIYSTFKLSVLVRTFIQDNRD